MIRSVVAFVLNDCALAYQAHWERSGDTKERTRARDTFRAAIDQNKDFVLPKLYLAELCRMEAEAATRQGDLDAAQPREAEMAQLLKEVLRREPDCLPAQLLIVEMEAKRSVRLNTMREELALEKSAHSDLSAVEDDGDWSLVDPREQLEQLDEDRRDCNAMLEEVLRRLLPHPAFEADDGCTRLAADGRYVKDLLADKEVRWTKEFTETHVQALVQWVNAMAPIAPDEADLLCEKLRSVYHRCRAELLDAHVAVATEMSSVLNSEAVQRRGEELEKDCMDLVGELIEASLKEDPLHNTALDVADVVPKAKRREFLLDAAARATSPTTLLTIAAQLRDVDETEEAVRAYGRARRRDEGALRSEHYLSLGELEAKLRRPASAVEAFRRAAEVGDVDAAARATATAASLVEETSGRQRAREELLRGAGNAEIALALAELLGSQGREEEAAVVYRDFLARDGGASDEQRGWAQLAFAQLLMDAPEGPSEEAREVLGVAVFSGLLPVRSRAAALLSVLLAATDPERSKQLAQQAIDEEDPVVVAPATVQLALLLEAEGETEPAAELRRKYASKYSWVALFLGDSLNNEGKYEAAAEMYELGADPASIEPTYAADAMLHHGDLLVARGEKNGAEALYWRVVESRDLEVAPEAVLRLEQLRSVESVRSRARFYRAVMKKVDRPLIAGFARRLGQLLNDEGRPIAAKAVYRSAREQAPEIAVRDSRLRPFA
jgi:tetratricopeptide (TPR) repeat protein